MSYETMKKTINCCEKGPFKSKCCCRFPFHCSDKNQDRCSYEARNKAFILANLMHKHIVIVRNI